MRRFRVGRVAGIPLELDVTFLLILPVFAWVIGSQVTELVDLLGLLGVAIDAGPLTEGAVPWVLGTVAAIGLFVGVVLHELGHALVARRFGSPIESITLWLFGGIARLEELPEDWRQELAIALAGPAVSVALGLLAGALTLVVPAGMVASDPIRFVVGYLAVMNLALAAFNLLPGFPMDGGRVLRALLARRRSYARATEIAAEVGKGFAILLGIVGVFTLDIFLVGLAFVVYVGAAGEARQTQLQAAFEGVTVADVMTPAADVTAVDVDDSVRALLATMLRERHTGYPVTDAGGGVVGVVTLDDAREVPEVERDAYLVRDVMSTDLATASPRDEVTDALERLDDRGVGRLLVFDDEQFAGIVSRTDIMTALSILQSGGETGPSLGRVPGGPR